MSDPLIIKICGIKTERILDAAIDAGADMIGLMHFPRSPRHLELDPIGELISLARGRVETCVVLVNPDNTLVAQVAALGPDWIQLHGPETPHRVETIRDEAGIAILKVCSIGGADDVAAVAGYADCADRILLDAKPPHGASRPGGLGEPFDWTLLKALDPELAFMLSGGLTPDTVAAAIKATRPMGVDVSSGVESAPGVKDAALIRAFIANARSAAAS
ncbi:MAG: phosphoribosylanthranilate isomerase [Devosia sp.]